MDVELLAKRMRESALLRQADPRLTEKDLEGPKLELEKRKQKDRVTDLKKLYFNAGRWAGGARDRTARSAFEQINGRGKIATN